MIGFRRTTFLQALRFAGLVAVTSSMVAAAGVAQTTAAPTFTASTVGSTTTLTISDATPNASIYYATGGRAVSIHSVRYTGPLTITLPEQIQALAVAPGLAASSVASASYTTVIGSTSLTSSLNPAAIDQPITYTATFTPAFGTSVPSGALQFYVNNVPLGPAQQLESNGTASYTTSKLPVAFMSVTASYIPAIGAPDTTSTSPAVVQGVYYTLSSRDNVFFTDAVKPLGSGFTFGTPYGVAVDSSDNVFVVDPGNRALYELPAADQYATVNELGNGFRFAGPTSVAVAPAGDLYVTDSSASAVYHMTPNDGYTSVGGFLAGLFSWPYGVAVGPAGDVFVADTGDHQVKWSPAPAGTSLFAIGGGFQYPWAITVDSSSNVFVSDIGTHTVNMIAGPINLTETATPLAPSGFFSNPYGVAVDANDDLYVSDLGYTAVREISMIDGWSTISTPGNGFITPMSVAVDATGNLFVADSTAGAVEEVTLAGGNFGTVKTLSTTPYSISMTFFFDAPFTLGGTTIIGQNGSASADFTDAGTGTCFSATPYAGVSTCTVDVVFTPQQAGARIGTVELLDQTGYPVAYGLVQGIGN